MGDLLIWLLAASISASPEPDWRWMGMSEGPDGRRSWYVDKASLVRSGDKVGFVEVAIFRPAGQAEVMEEEHARVEGDCAGRTMTFYPQDRSTGAERKGVTIPAAAKSAAGDMLDSVCKGKFAARVRDVVMNAHLLFEVTPRKRKKAR